MTPQRSFWRKIWYLVAMLCLLPLLFWLGHPSTSDVEGSKGSPGGRLSQSRRENKFGVERLGKVDPTSQTIKLATFGMRGVAANILWTKVNAYKMKKDWTNLSATLEQMIKVQPNYVDVWRHQGWNLAYNCSTEFDDYRQRYRWVIKGINFLKKGTEYNTREPRLLRDIGWIISQKIGRADEHKQFRRLFKEDDDFHGPRPKSDRDNWLVGKLWVRRAENLVDTTDATMRGTSPLIFRAEAPMCQMNYAAALEEDGVFGEKARGQWKRASSDWSDFGKFNIPTSDGTIIRLGEQRLYIEQAAKLAAKLDALEPGLGKKILQERMAKLTKEQTAALATPLLQRTPEQYELAAEAAELIKLTHREIAQRITGPYHEKAMKLAEQAEQVEQRARRTASYRQIVNYDYWELRAKVERLREMIRARQLVFKANQDLADGYPKKARDLYVRGSKAWAVVLAKYPMLAPDKATSDDLLDVIEQFTKTLDQLDEVFPEDFALTGFIRMKVFEEDDARIARDHAMAAMKAVAENRFNSARQEYARSLDKWRQLLDKFPSLRLMSDRRTARELLQIIDAYAEVHKRLDLPFPENFPLQQFVWVQAEHAEQTKTARTLIEQADKAFNQNDTDGARKAYEAGLAAWRKVLDSFPSLVSDNNTNEELMLTINRYRQVLKRTGEKMPENFVLQDIIDRNER